MLEIRPITFREASEFINNYHRHHKATVGCKFCVSVWDYNKLVGVAVCGRPVSRKLDDGTICEINRLCTDGTFNACSMLYGACCRIAKNMGYKKIVTYILESENGSSLKASNFICEGVAGKTHWTGERNKGQDIPKEMKTRWSRVLQNETGRREVTEVKDMANIEEKQFQMNSIVTDKMIDLVKFREKEPELFEELVADYPAEGTNFFIAVMPEKFVG